MLHKNDCYNNFMIYKLENVIIEVLFEWTLFTVILNTKFLNTFYNILLLLSSLVRPSDSLSFVIAFLFPTAK